jgi:nucleoside 2-deoxyribosyltransferase
MQPRTSKPDDKTFGLLRRSAGIATIAVVTLFVCYYFQAQRLYARQSAQRERGLPTPKAPSRDPHAATSGKVAPRTIYLAAPLFSESERLYNKRLQQQLATVGLTVVLPQELGAEIVRAAKPGWQSALFSSEQKELSAASAVLCVLDGSDVDSGTAWEVGVAYAMKKPIVGIRTDIRNFGSEGKVNLMLQESCSSIEENPASAIKSLERILKTSDQ